MCGSDGGGVPQADAPVSVVAGWLVAERGRLDRGEAGWLEALGRFDAAQGWAVDGHLSPVGWVMWSTGLARQTAYEKLRMARQLRVRPRLAATFAAGVVGYSAVRAITRIDVVAPVVPGGPTLSAEDVDDLDGSLLGLARVGTVADLEVAVRHHQGLVDQERPPADPDRHRQLQVHRHDDGTGTVEVTLSGLELDEFETVLDAFIPGREARAMARAELSSAEDSSPAGETADGLCDGTAGVDLSSAEDSTAAGGPDGGLDDGGVAGVSSAEDTGPGPVVGEDPDAGRHWPARRADGFVGLVRTALAHAGGGQAMGADRYLVHLIALPGGGLVRADGSPLGAVEAQMVGCDAGMVVHHRLGLGRRQRSWSTAQRRHIGLRDGGRCRFPGCGHRRVDIHHLLPWHAGGATDVANGVLVCRRHHVLLHHDVVASGDAEGTLSFTRAGGRPVGSSTAWGQLAMAATARTAAHRAVTATTAA